MQWNARRHAGFSEVEPWLAVAASGDLLAYLRRTEEEVFLVALNLGNRRARTKE